ncbi:MAG: nucleotide sugar dehydrogenase [Candidatus Omnitrophota bacterium]
MFEKLKLKINKKEAKIAVIGLGYVGLPLAVEYAKRGFTVFGIDNDKDRINKAKNLVPYILDVPTEDIKNVLDKNKLFPTTQFNKLGISDVAIICVPTPLKRKYQPDISYIISAAKEIKKYIHKNQLVVLESTTYPGTTEEVILPLLESSGLKCGRDFLLAFSPERIDPGNEKFPVYKIPKVVGGLTPEATILTKLLYENIIEKVVPVSSTKVAETVKLLENTFRIVNIALINEIAMMAHKMNMDIWEIIEAASTKPFGFMSFYPGPGVGGHCIPKDPLYLYWKAKLHGFKSRFIKLASDINNAMPDYVVSRVSAGLKKRGKNLSSSKVLIVGVTYKRDVKDLRKSPGIEIIDIFKSMHAHVAYYDPLIPFLKINNINLKSVTLDKKTLKSFDCVVIVTDHSDINYQLISDNSKLIFDTRNVFKRQNPKIERL